MTKTWKEKIVGNRLTPARVAILGMLLALMITFKYIFGFVPGVEVVSFMFIFLALFLPLIDLVLLVAAFNFLVMAIYGFGSWWIAYWPIFMLDALVSFSLRKVSKHRFFFAFLCFLGGISVGFWYFLSDMLFFGKTFATLNLITAIPINLIEGFTSMILALLFGPVLVRVFQVHAHKFWNADKLFKFKPIKNKFLTYFMSILLALLAVSGTITLFVFNHKFLEWRQSGDVRNQRLDPNIPRSDKRLITTQDYNKIYDNLKQDDSAVVLVVGNKHWTYYAKNSNHKKLKELISNNKFYISFRKNVDPTLGEFLRQAFLTKNDKQISPDDSTGKIGTSKDFDSSPFIYVNGRTSSIGSNLELHSKDIVEISYNGYWTKFTGPSSVSHVGQYYVNKYGTVEKPKNQIWIPITIGVSAFLLLIALIWMPNLIDYFKNKKNI